jgi:hypothetical protein
LKFPPYIIKKGEIKFLKKLDLRMKYERLKKYEIKINENDPFSYIKNVTFNIKNELKLKLQ